VDDLGAATGKLDRYAQRFKIETYHKVLKSGCRAERAGLRTAERLTNLRAVLCVVAWRVFTSSRWPSWAAAWRGRKIHRRATWWPGVG
jgi:hypothetical protein